MLNFTFYQKQGNPIIMDVLEDYYERLANSGLAKQVLYSDYKIKVEEEEYDILAVKLDFDNRDRILKILEVERQKELKKFFAQINNPTIKEIRENLDFVKFLTDMYERIKDEESLYFSYE